MGKRNRNMRKSRFEKEAEQYIKTHDDYRVFALDDADLMQIFKDGAELGFQKGIKTQVKEMACCDGEQDKPNVFQKFCKKEFPEDIQRRVERAAEYGESNAEYFFRAGFFLAHELEEAKKNNQDGDLPKEAEEYYYDRLDPKAIDSISEIADKHTQKVVTSSFIDGATYGYNKAKEEMKKNGLALQQDMDKTIKQNLALKAQIEELKKYYEGFEVMFNFKDFMNGGKR